jgi:hypothetical protein
MATSEIAQSPNKEDELVMKTEVTLETPEDSPD